MKLISLIDNTAVDDKLFSENGMSFFVEFGGKNYIIDTGLTGKAAENARRMQLPTDELDAVVPQSCRARRWYRQLYAAQP